MAKAGTIALVGSESLMGREIRDLLSTAGLPFEVRLIASEDEAAGTLTEQGGEASVIGGLDAEAFDDARIVFLAGSPAGARRAIELADGIPCIDLSYAADDSPTARLRAPMVEPPGFAADPAAVQVIAHPAAIAIALVLARVHEVHPVRRTVVHIFEPASERGAAALEELQQQTVGLLSFKNVPKQVFDEQLGFNLLARYGEEAPFALEDAEARIERHLATLLAMGDTAVPMPSLRLIQAPVFHGHSFSLWIEFEDNPGPAELEAVLSVENVDVREAGTDPPTAVGMAGQDGVAIGALAVDRNAPDACWVWMTADNLRLAGQNGMSVARQLL